MPFLRTAPKHSSLSFDKFGGSCIRVSYLKPENLQPSEQQLTRDDDQISFLETQEDEDDVETKMEKYNIKDKIQLI